MLIRLMGKSGSGKSLVSMLLKNMDNSIQIVDGDKIGHASQSDSNIEKLRKVVGEIYEKSIVSR